MATTNPITGKRMLTIPTSTPAPKQDVLGKLKDLGLGQKSETPTDSAYLEGSTSNIQNVYSGYSGTATPKRIVNVPSTDKSVAAMNANKNGTTSSLPQATPAGLPLATKYAGIDKGYGNNQAGIDLVNKQNELDTLSEAEKAQRLAGTYNPTPTVATAQQPVIKKGVTEEAPTVTPDILQGADINKLNSTLDELNYKVNVEGKTLTKEEYLTYAGAKRQLQDMMKPQALTGGLDGLITNKENEIKQVTDESKINNEQELADFTRSQEVYKQAEVDAIEQADAEQKKTLGYILGGQGAGESSFAVEQIGKITQNSLAKKQVLNEAVQAKIDLYGSQLRKDSQQTIQAMKDRLDSYYMKAAGYDVDNIKQMNEYNAKEGASKIEQIDKMMALAQSQAMAMRTLTEQEQAQAQAFAGNLYDNEGNFQNNVFEMLYKVNPKLANAAVMQGTAIQKERLSNDLAMRGLDADIKRAQLNKLLDPDIDRKDSGEVDANGNPILYDPKNPTNTTVIPVGSTDVGGLSGADLAKTLASGKIDGKKFFGVYATGDPDGTQFASIYNKAAEQGLDAYMKSRQDRGSKITADMVNQAAIATGVDPITIAAKMAQDSGMGTQGKGARNNNPGNVGQFDSLDAKGITVKGYNTLEDGVLAVADNFKKRQDALLSVAPQKKKDKPLTDTQFTQSNQVISSFKSDPQVKAFEEAYSNGINLLSSLNDASGPGDVAGIFQFMKTLDPQSVVREAEFETAAKSAGVREQFKNIPANKLEGTKLSPAQRIAFGKLAKKFIENKSTIYQTKYQDGLKRLEKQGIDTSVFPTNLAEGMNEYLGEQTTSTQPTTTGGGRRQG